MYHAAMNSRPNHAIKPRTPPALDPNDALHHRGVLVDPAVCIAHRRNNERASQVFETPVLWVVSSLRYSSAIGLRAPTGPGGKGSAGGCRGATAGRSPRSTGSRWLTIQLGMSCGPRCKPCAQLAPTLSYEQRYYSLRRPLGSRSNVSRVASGGSRLTDEAAGGIAAIRRRRAAAATCLRTPV